MRKGKLLLALAFVCSFVPLFASAACDQTFYGTLRYNKQYKFYDDFKANSSDKWLRNWDMDYNEEYDYNNSSDFPQFGWTSNIRNADWKVAKNTSMRVIEADSAYPILSVPTSRSYNNFSIIYTLTYSTDEAGKHKYTHTECKYYEISRCGDGVIDTSYGEKCDPKDPNKTGWGNGGCDNSCNPVTVAAPVCNSEYNGQRVSSLSESSKLCSEGTASDFKYDAANHKWTWKCKNTAGEGVDCSAIKPYCGDGIKDSDEKCDPKDPNKAGWGNGGCDNSCNPITVAGPSCNSEYNGQRVSSLSESSKLCSEGTASDFKYDAASHKWTWKCKNTAGEGVDCSATKPYCGDGIKDSDEKCDPKDPNKTGWGNGGCDNSCNPITVAGPSCNSEYNGQRVSSLSESSKLCSEGTASDFKYDSTNHKWTWKCKNTLGEGVDCSATKPYCGDGIKDSDEKCDPKDPNKAGWGNGGCDNSCNPITVAGPSCNSEYNGQRVSSLSESSKLCSEGTASDFKYDAASHKWTWKCKNTAGEGVDCSAIKPYCGDGIKDSDEKCDYKDPSQTGWGNGGCDNSCEPITISEGCDESFYGTLRFGRKYTFYDDFNANSSDKWLRNWSVEYQEEYDYNQSPTFPSFGWTTQLINNNYKVAKNTTMRVLEARSEYPILAVPASRSYDNLFIKYSLVYSTDPAGNNKYGDAECGYYEISRCGDGVLDTEYGEKCDPKDPNKAGWGNGGCDNSCEPVTIPETGKLKIEKTLIGSKEIKNTGDNVVWTIKVTAEGGNVTDFVVVDKMPPILGYKDYLVTHNEGLTIGSPVVAGNEVSWDVKGTLEKGKYIEIQLTTYAKEMPDHDYDNVACVKYDGKEECDDESVPAPKLWIKKYFTDGTKTKTVKIGDLIGYKVTFGNKGTASATITSLKDFLPKNVEYVSSEIFVNGQPVHSNETDSGVYVDVYSGLTLEPKAEGYIILTGKVLSDNQDSRTNFACIYLNDNKIDCDDVIHVINTGDVMCKSDIKMTDSANLCNGNSWTVPVKCESDGGAANIAILCDNNVVTSGQNISQLAGNCVFSSDGNHSVKCEVNGTTTAVSGSNCEGVYNLSHHSCGGGDDPHCKAPEIVNSGDYIKEVTCKTDNDENYLIGVTCYDGDTIHVSSGKVSSFTYTCKYDKSGKYNIQCYVPRYKTSDTVTKDDTKPSQCGTGAQISYLCKSVTVDPADSRDVNRKVTCETSLPADEVESIAIYCNYDNDKNTAAKTGSKVSSIVGECNYSSDGTYKVQCVVNGKVEDSCAATAKKSSGGGSGGGGGGGGGGGKCTLQDGTSTNSSNPICKFANPHCFNVNAGNVSIEEGEILPLYFNIFKDKTKIDDYNFIVYEEAKYPLGKTSSYDGILSDTGKCNPGDVALNSLKCTYQIIDGKGNVVYRTTVACLDNGSNVKQGGLVGAWFNWQKKTYGTLQSVNDNGYTFTTNVEMTQPSSWKKFNGNNLYYGEYKVQISKVEYLQCDPNGKWKSDDATAVCQSNFTLTNSYTVQKTPSGNIKASTTELDNYLFVDGNNVINSGSILLNAIATSEYEANSKVDDAMTNFINKYKKLAVTVKNGLMKVPGKSIYFVDRDILLGCKDSEISLKTPTTVVQTSGDTRICGSVDNLNIMILTKGSIRFTDPNSCNNRQVVKGIFYAEKGIIKDRVQKNDNKNNTQRCTGGGLTIKGVLIGKGLQKMMENSRSNLNNWFKTSDNQKTTDDQKKTTIMNGASVLIEYSPSVFTKSTMPPGAEYFTTALSIYKN